MIEAYRADTQETVMRKQAERIAELEGMLMVQADALRDIAFMGMDKTMQADGESFYNSQLRNCISIAANTIASNAATAETVQACQDMMTEPDAQLCKFYQVKTYPELVKTMLNHIERLQSKVPQIQDTQPRQVRKG